MLRTILSLQRRKENPNSTDQGSLWQKKNPLHLVERCIWKGFGWPMASTQPGAKSREMHPTQTELVIREKSLLLAPMMLESGRWKDTGMPQRKTGTSVLAPAQSFDGFATTPGAPFCLQVTLRWIRLTEPQGQVTRVSFPFGWLFRPSRHNSLARHNWLLSFKKGSRRESIQSNSVTEALDAACDVPSHTHWVCFGHRK